MCPFPHHERNPEGKFTSQRSQHQFTVHNSLQQLGTYEYQKHRQSRDSSGNVDKVHFLWLLYMESATFVINHVYYKCMHRLQVIGEAWKNPLTATLAEFDISCVRLVATRTYYTWLNIFVINLPRKYFCFLFQQN